jgi:hypothetical protein
MRSSTDTWGGRRIASRWAMYLMRGVYFRIISSRLAGSGAGDPPVDFRLLE